MHTHRIFISMIVFSVFALPASAQVATPSAADGAFRIAAVEYLIEGETKEFFLAAKAGIDVGHSFKNRSDLENYLADKRQVLLNERVLETVAIEYTLGIPEAGFTPVNVSVLVKDSMNIIALPYFLYDSNSGIVLSARGRHYNFLGSMQTLVLNFDFKQNLQGRNSYGGYTNFEIPFVVNDFLLGLGFSGDLRVYDDGAPPTASTSVSLSATYKEFGFPIWASLSQGLTTNPDGVFADADPYLLRTTFSAGARLTIQDEVSDLGPLTWSPSAALSGSWRIDAPVRADRQGLNLALSQSVNVGRVDWVANMKRGLSFSVSNSNYFNFLYQGWAVDFDAQASFFATWKGLIAMKSRVQAFDRAIGGNRIAIGSPLRGVRDARVDGYAGVFVNLDFPVKLFDFPTHLLIGKNWFDFELQATPFIDYGYVLPSIDAAPTKDDSWLTGGIEFYVYPLRMRSFIVRIGLGFDLVNAMKTGSFTEPTLDGWNPFEFFFGLGLAY